VLLRTDLDALVSEAGWVALVFLLLYVPAGIGYVIARGLLSSTRPSNPSRDLEVSDVAG
jgi:hypothetical protein